MFTALLNRLMRQQHRCISLASRFNTLPESGSPATRIIAQDLPPEDTEDLPPQVLQAGLEARGAWNRRWPVHAGSR